MVHVPSLPIATKTVNKLIFNNRFRICKNKPMPAYYLGILQILHTILSIMHPAGNEFSPRQTFYLFIFNTMARHPKNRHDSWITMGYRGR
jgi:hypothetical protein